MLARRVVAALLMSLACSAIFTFWLSRTFFKSRSAAPAAQHYVATVQGVDAGQVLLASNLKVIEWPANVPLQGAFVKPEELAGRTLLYPLSAGEPILDRDLSVAGSGLGLSTKIPDGMRAISLRSDQIVGVAGFLQPGTHVDVLVTYHTQGSPEPITSTVLQDAQILAAGQKMQPDPEGKPSATDVVTLLVTPSDAERVVLASAQGTVHFVLRNGSDHQQLADAPAQLSELSGNQRAPLSSDTAIRHETNHAPVAAAKPYTVQTIAGGKQTVETFQ